MPNKEIIIYTDGSSLGNPGPGGYAVVMISGKARKELSQGFRLTTNNRMEILAVIMALKAIKTSTGYNINIYTDSNLVVQTFNKKWIKSWKQNNWKKSNKEPVLNTDLWKELDKLVELHKPNFIHILGHTGIIENERCDKLCKQAATGDNLGIDTNYENGIKGINTNEPKIF